MPKYKGIDIIYDDDREKNDVIVVNLEPLKQYLLNTTDWDGDLDNLPYGMEILKDESR